MLANDLMNSFLRVFLISVLREVCSELTVVELHFGLLFFSVLFMLAVGVLLFKGFKAELFFNSFRAVTSLHYKLFCGLDTVISASCVMTFSK